ncbi:hybrid sensor histidine kinase/response regulator [Pseudomonas duriflava]|nr:hybrid sensor histidine kinase/response regulator [Pseudomonas duriflava]
MTLMMPGTNDSSRIAHQRVREHYGLEGRSCLAELEAIVERAQQAFAPAQATICLSVAEDWCVLAGQEPSPEAAALYRATLHEPELCVITNTKANPALSRAGILFYAGTALKTADGTPVGVLALLGDTPRAFGTTERWLLQEMARGAMAQLELYRLAAQRESPLESSNSQKMLDSAVDYAIFCTDLQRNVIEWNEGASRVLGWSREEMLGHTADQIFTPSDRALGIPLQEAETALNQGRSADERWHMRKTGERFWASGEMMPLVQATGEVTGFIKILRDRTEQRQTVLELQASRSNYRLLLDSMSEGFYSVDRHGIVTLCNTAFVTLFGGRDEAELIGQRLEDLIEPTCGTSMDQMAGSPIYRVMEHGTAEQVLDGVFCRRDGSCIPVEYRAQAILQNGNVQGALCTVVDMSERVQARQDWQLAVMLIQQSADFIGIASPDGHPSFVNEAGRRLVGLDSMDAVRNTRILDYFMPEDRPYVESVILPAVQQGGKWTGEFRFLDRRSGQPVPVHYSVFTVRNDTGDISAIAAIARDLSQQQRIERRAEESEALVRSLTDLSPGIIWFGNPDGSLSYLNRYWYDYTGQTPEKALPSGWADAVHPDDIDELQRIWLDVRTRGIFYEVESRFRRHDGSYRWFHIRAQPLHDETGTVTGWLGNNHDIHDRTLAEEASRRLTETLEQRVAERTADLDRMWRLTTDVMLVARFDGTITAANPAWQTLLGWREEELLGQVLLDFVHPDDISGTLSEVDKLAQGYTTLRFENRYRHKNGSYRWLSWTAVPDDQFIHAVGRDVEAEKASAQELTRAQEQLRQAQKMEAVGQLTGGIAHDFNNLLTGIIGSLELMRMRVQQGKLNDIERFANTALSSANRAAALTHRLLAFSRRQPLDPKVVDVNTLVMGMDELLHRTMGEAVKLEIVRAGGLWLTLCDPHQLENAILNLAINARTAMPNGGTLIIETCNTSLDEAYSARNQDIRPGQYVCVSVTDTGVGMTPEIIAKAFDPFFTTKPLGEGTGLGLSMVYGFTRQSEGAAKIYSEVDKGTTVKLYLPRYYGEATPVQDSPALERMRSHAGTDEVVLVVEDEHAVRGLVIEVLGELGYRALEAADGPTGLEILRSDLSIDLLVTDVGLPGLNGRLMVEQARQSRPDLKVLFMTGYAENAVIANGFLEPGMAMITKPFPIEALAMRIRDMIESG